MKTHYRIEKMPDASACRLTVINYSPHNPEILIAEGAAWNQFRCTEYANENGYTLHVPDDEHGVIRCFKPSDMLRPGKAVSA